MGSKYPKSMHLNFDNKCSRDTFSTTCIAARCFSSRLIVCPTYAALLFRWMCRLGDPEKYLFSLPKKYFFGMKVSKTIVCLIFKTEALVTYAGHRQCFCFSQCINCIPRKFYFISIKNNIYRTRISQEYLI